MRVCFSFDLNRPANLRRVGMSPQLPTTTAGSHRTAARQFFAENTFSDRTRCHWHSTATARVLIPARCPAVPWQVPRERRAAVGAGRAAVRARAAHAAPAHARAVPPGGRGGPAPRAHRVRARAARDGAAEGPAVGAVRRAAHDRPGRCRDRQGRLMMTRTALESACSVGANDTKRRGARVNSGRSGTTAGRQI